MAREFQWRCGNVTVRTAISVHFIFHYYTRGLSLCLEFDLQAHISASVGLYAEDTIVFGLATGFSSLCLGRNLEKLVCLWSRA